MSIPRILYNIRLLLPMVVNLHILIIYSGLTYTAQTFKMIISGMLKDERYNIKRYNH